MWSLAQHRHANGWVGATSGVLLGRVSECGCSAHELASSSLVQRRMAQVRTFAEFQEMLRAETREVTLNVMRVEPSQRDFGKTEVDPVTQECVRVVVVVGCCWFRTWWWWWWW